MSLDERVADHARERFAKHVLAAAQESGLAQVWYDPARYAIAYQRVAGERPAWLDLERPFGDFGDTSGPARQRRILQLVVSMVNAPAPPQSWDEARAQLRPIVQSASFALTAPAGAAMLTRPALPHLAQYVVIELASGPLYVTREQVASWGVGEADVFAQAWANLGAATPVHMALAPSGRRPLRFVDHDDPYFATRLLLPGRLAALAGWVSGRPVAFLPDRSTIILSPDNPDSLARVYEVAGAEYAEANWPLSPQGYTLDDNGAILPYSAPVGHPVSPRVRAAAALLSATEYATQGRLLETRPDLIGSDVVLGAVNVVHTQDQGVRTVTSWAGSPRELLPTAEYLMVRSPEEDEVVIVPWRVATEALDLVPIDGLKPPRYVVRSRPTAETWERLRPIALDSKPAYVPKHGDRGPA
ncbi:hypothetical protein [Luedemannella helvata]|uniref:DUF1444 family protein n=1 Tax=Luedemannella helvata TaxID=349315 RepID=A0ABN2L1L5_9ACTN